MKPCDIKIREGAKRVTPYEYFCEDCRQLRWSAALSDSCGNCGSKKIIKGEPGTLLRKLRTKVL